MFNATFVFGTKDMQWHFWHNLTRIIEKYPQLAKWETQKEMMEKFTKMEGQNGSVPTQLTHFPVQMYYSIY